MGDEEDYFHAVNNGHFRMDVKYGDKILVTNVTRAQAEELVENLRWLYDEDEYDDDEDMADQ
jgi:hypothetical protein